VVVGATVEAVDGVAVGAAAAGRVGGQTFEAALAAALHWPGRPAGAGPREVVLTLDCSGGPCPGREAWAKYPLKDCPYVPPASRAVAKAAVRTRLEYEAWQAARPSAAERLGRLWAADPLVLTYDGFFSAEEMTHIQARAKGSMRVATVSSTKGGATTKGRTNTVTWLNHDSDETVRPAPP
jgi:hypothetical protein